VEDVLLLNKFFPIVDTCLRPLSHWKVAGKFLSKVAFERNFPV